jgi:hypothetical protein
MLIGSQDRDNAAKIGGGQGTWRTSGKPPNAKDIAILDD